MTIVRMLLTHDRNCESRWSKPVKDGIYNHWPVCKLFNWNASWLTYFKNRLRFVQSDSRLSVFVGLSVGRESSPFSCRKQSHPSTTSLLLGDRESTTRRDILVLFFQWADWGRWISQCHLDQQQQLQRSTHIDNVRWLSNGDLQWSLLLDSILIPKSRCSKSVGCLS